MMSLPDNASATSVLKRYFPLAAFAVMVMALILSAAFSFADLVSTRSTLATQNELLAKLKQKSVAGTKAALDVRDYIFDAPSQGVATAELQRRVSELLNAGGADLQLSEIIPADQDGDVGRMAIAVNFEIDEERVIDLLYTIENAKPALIIERLSLRSLTTSTPSVARRRLQGTATIAAAWRSAS